MQVLLLSFLASLFATLVIIRYQHLHSHLTGDHALEGAQKFHAHAVPRVGGLGVALGLGCAAVLLLFKHDHTVTIYLYLLIAACPAFLGGLIEDISKHGGIIIRLGLTMISALLGYFFLDASLIRLDIPWIDPMLSLWPIALLLTILAVAGVANAINIIDGFNGLASMVSIMILGAMAYVSHLLGDHFLWNACISTIGCLLGFFVWNFPRGLIFLGDSGAYLIGFLIGEIAVLLVARHPEVSAWFPLLVVIYPVFETIFSIYRKRFLRGMSPAVPDGLHLHMLVFKRLVRWAAGHSGSLRSANAATSPYLWLLCSFSVIPAVLFWNNTLVLMAMTAAFCSVYVHLYWRIVNFRKPRLLKKRITQ